MEITSEQAGPVAVVSIFGSIDALTAGEVTGSFTEQIDRNQVRLVADLSGVDFMSSAGLRAILAVLKASRQQGGDLRLAAARPGVEKILRMSGFTSILKYYSTVEEAVDSFNAQQP